MFRNLKTVVIISNRPFKNFGHKRQPVPLVTTIWHGFLTCTFIGLGIEWKRWVEVLFVTVVIKVFPLETFRLKLFYLVLTVKMSLSRMQTMIKIYDDN